MENSLPQNPDPKRKPWFLRHPILICACVVILLVLIASAINQNSSANSSSINSNSAQPSSNATPTTLSATTSPSSDTFSFTPTTIQDLVDALDTNAQSGNTGYPTGTPELIQVTDRVTQKAVFQYASKSGDKTTPTDYIKVEDPNGYTALLLLDPTKLGFQALYDQVTVGDTLLIRGAAGSTPCDPTDAESISFCNTLNITQMNVPILVGMEPMPEGGNKEPLEFESSQGQ